MEELPIIQRRIVKHCIRSGKPVVVATHMLESMITNPIPTRAEITDVANAVFEQADAVMLSGETTVGRYPVEFVQMLHRVAQRIERSGGGGILNSGSMTMSNCTVTGNSVGATGLATMYGGGISNGGNLQITSSTIVYNSASGENGAFGGGIYSSAPTRSDSSIIALNSAPTGPDVTGEGGLQSMGYNIVGNNADAVSSSQPTDQIGTPAAPIDPLLSPLANNGGLTLTHALQAGSPAIDRGDPAAPPRGPARV